MTIAISPGGFLGIYMLGTMAYMKRTYDLDHCRIGGTSAGALVSLYALSTASDEELVERVFLPAFKNMQHLRWPNVLKVVETSVHPMMHTVEYERGFVTLTHLDRKYPPRFHGELRTSFADVDDYLQCTLASAHVPFLCGGVTSPYEDGRYMDGAITLDARIFDNTWQSTHTIHVSPQMWGRRFTLYDSVKIGRTRALRLFHEGYMDAAKHGRSLPLKKRPILARIRRTMEHHRIRRDHKHLLNV